MSHGIQGWILGTWLAASAAAHAAAPDWAAVDRAMGRPGVEQPGGVHKYAFPRSDLQITVDGVALKPALALGGWAALMPTSAGAMLMGDLVLTDAEIGPVMQRLIAAGLEVSAVHNHLLRTSTPIVYMHIGGHGDAVRLAQGLHDALAASRTPEPGAAASPAPLDLDTAALDRLIGAAGKANGGVYQFSIPRAEPITQNGMQIPPALGVAMPLNFQPTGAGKAAVTGDFVLLGSEVQAVVQTLRSQGIEVTALHSHMIDETPRLYFLHFWANDDALKLARSLRSALDHVNARRNP